MKSSIFQNFVKYIGDQSLIVITKLIQDGKYKNQVLAIRSLIEDGNQAEADNQKKQLPAFTPSGIFHNGRKANLLSEYSCHVILDIDKIPVDEITTVIENAAKVPHTFAAFISPSGNGDRVTVTVRKQIISKEVVKLMDKANQEYQLKQKEIIALGLIAQHSSLTSIQLSKILNQKDETGLRNWLGRLIDLDLIQTKGKTKGTEYFVNPDYLRKLNFKGKTDLKKIEPHRLQELIYQDLLAYPRSQIGDINTRIGQEIAQRKLKAELDKLVENGRLSKVGEKRWTKYSINKSL